MFGLGGLLIGKYVSALSILKGIAGRMVLDVVVRLMIRMVMRAPQAACMLSEFAFGLSTSAIAMGPVDSLLDGAGAAKKGTAAES
jgi:hypothetical protein